jgi:hypothetical protein
MTGVGAARIASCMRCLEVAGVGEEQTAVETVDDDTRRQARLVVD